MSEEPNENDFDKRKKALNERLRAKHGDNYRLYERYKMMPHMDLVHSALEKDKIIDGLEIQIRKFEKEIGKLRGKLKIHDPESGDPPDYTGFSFEWTNLRKIVFILKRNAQALTSVQVLEQLLKLEPSKEYDWDNPLNNVSRILNRAIQKNLVVKIDADMGYPLYKTVKMDSM
jgi:hypothetical protein